MPIPRRLGVLILLVFGVSLTSLVQEASAQVKAFPQAEGFGQFATGGRGGDVYHVTNLTDSGPGSLRFGVENAPTAGRTIVFDVGGWITLTSKLGLTKSRVTIAGQTAPGGVGIRNGQFSVGGDDVIVRHMRFRPGKITNTDHDSVNTNENAHRVIYDHISAEFSTDGGFDLQADEVTLQYSSVSFGLLTHSTGGLIQSPTGGAAGLLSFHHNMFAHNETRNPKARAELIDWRDNVIYNYHNGFLAGESETDVNPNWRANFDGNTYISNVGGNAGSGGRPMMTGGRLQNYDLWYGVNALDRDSDAQDDPIVYTMAQAQANQSVVSSQYNWFNDAFPAADVWQSGSPAAAYQRVLQQFGATPWARDAVNQLIYNQVQSRTGQRISNENQLGIANAGYPDLNPGNLAAPLDTDADGMPDAWESRHGANPLVASNNQDFDQDGYTDLEEYLNDLAAFPAVGALEFQGVGRYADSSRWTRDWEPSRVDDVQINAGAAFVDAVGQKAGSLTIGGTGRLYLTSGWLEVTDDVTVGGRGVDQWGGELRAGSVAIQSDVYRLRDGALRTASLTKSVAGAFSLEGGTLAADTVGFDLVNEGGTFEVGASGVAAALVSGGLTMAGGSLEMELAGPSVSDMLVVSGNAALDGDLVIETVGGYVPSPGASWTILSAGSISGGFASVTSGYSVQQVGNTLMLSYTAAGALLAPEPAALALAALPLIALLRRRRQTAVACLFAVAMLAPASESRAVSVSAVADAQLSENGTTGVGDATSTGSGGGNDLNVRWSFAASPPNRNEWIALKFDLSAFDEKTRLQDVALRTTMNRASTGNTTTLRLYALQPGHVGNGWNEATVTYGTMAGFTFDANSTTNVLDVGATLVDLGTFGVSGADAEGAVPTINPASLGNLVRSMGSHDTLTLLLSAGVSSTSQWRIASREATSTATGVVTGAAGSLAARLEFTISTTGVAGDYNDDGVVNAADYVVWRDADATPLPNEEVSPGSTDLADYLYWVERFGATDVGQLVVQAPAPGGLGLSTVGIGTLGLAFSGRPPRRRRAG